MWHFCSHDQSSVAKLLIQHGASLDSIDQRGLTLMATIIRNMRLDCEHLAKLLVYAGYDLSKDDWLKPPELRNCNSEISGLKIPIPHGRVEKLCNWLRNKQQDAERLANLCRISIRTSLKIKQNGRSIVESTSVLPIPNSLKLFILLNEWMYWSHFTKCWSVRWWSQWPFASFKARTTFYLSGSLVFYSL